jgi:hypothetical protein
VLNNLIISAQEAYALQWQKRGTLLFRLLKIFATSSELSVNSVWAGVFMVSITDWYIFVTIFNNWCRDFRCYSLQLEQHPLPSMQNADRNQRT